EPIVEIITKSGNGLQIGRRRFNFIVFFPLGYSKPVEFYSPKYDTPEAFNSEKIDLRTTIYWKPNVTVDSEGRASVDFYTADMPTSYSAVIEGVFPDGTLIYEHRKAVIKVE
ncbi:MAG: TonB-dependent receptor, partial [Dysgonamonadaceae bacterium]|nr:TonB-dependent receptor [Dysgonamonadaceae bacterium]